MWTGLLGVGAEDRVALPPVRPAARPATAPPITAPLAAPHFGNAAFARAAPVQ